MKLAFCLPKYFRFGGLQSNFMRIAEQCRLRGWRIVVYTLAWEGEIPAEFTVHVPPIRALRNHTRNMEFTRKVHPMLQQGGFDAVIGFMKMPGLDLYYAADPCFQHKVRRHRHRWYRLGARYRHFAAFEQEVFGVDRHTEILILTEAEMANYMGCYGTQKKRFHLLPPGISRDCMAPDNAAEIRNRLRCEFAISDRFHLILALGSGFKTKGLDRTLRALAALPQTLRQATRLLVVGEGRTAPFRWLARRLGIAGQVRFLAGRDDVKRFLLGADLLIHPAYTENTGNVILEAIVAGLPVLATANCGYAPHVERAGAGKVVTVPFHQRDLNVALAEMLLAPEREHWSKNGIAYGRREDLYSRPEVVADIIQGVANRLKRS